MTLIALQILRDFANCGATLRDSKPDETSCLGADDLNLLAEGFFQITQRLENIDVCICAVSVPTP